MVSLRSTQATFGRAQFVARVERSDTRERHEAFNLRPLPGCWLIVPGARPICRQYPRRDVTMKRRPRPLDHVFHMAVFAWVVMDVIDMAGKVFIVTNTMLPLTLLPDAAFSLALAAGRYVLARWQGSGKAALDQAPA